MPAFDPKRSSAVHPTDLGAELHPGLLTGPSSINSCQIESLMMLSTTRNVVAMRSLRTRQYCAC